MFTVLFFVLRAITLGLHLSLDDHCLSFVLDLAVNILVSCL